MLENRPSAARSFEVKEILGKNREINAVGNTLTTDGLVLETPASMLEDNQFLWLEIGLPNSSERIKALAEIVDRSDSHVQVRFKHLFPDQRQKLYAHLCMN